MVIKDKKEETQRKLYCAEAKRREQKELQYIVELISRISDE